ncbi:unnamed protein product [Didymodactylos carnosus]|uniref:Uncharacterized protein n=1 Tax=Didymodactylos carnosus TaxID=1234261 RepID=A0A814H6S2_9BILA|nr:unnamed protein product [Didymodactylos carnosus]CAF3777207.1 unnamed protein product [Didymodactylos carnosus]
MHFERVGPGFHYNLNDKTVLEAAQETINGGLAAGGKALTVVGSISTFLASGPGICLSLLLGAVVLAVIMKVYSISVSGIPLLFIKTVAKFNDPLRTHDMFLKAAKLSESRAHPGQIAIVVDE